MSQPSVNGVGTGSDWQDPWVSLTKSPFALADAAHDAGRHPRAAEQRTPRLHAYARQEASEFHRTPPHAAQGRTSAARPYREERNMHRSSSYCLSTSSTATSSSGTSGTAGIMDVDQLPTYDPRSDVAKKEALDASRAGLARTLVHLIPVVVLLCGLLLWSLSATDTPDVGIMLEKGGGDKMVTHVKLMPQKTRSPSRWNSSGMMTGMEDSDPIDKAHVTKRRVLRSEM
ncbi:uncharacterized protein LOC133884166 [Phragmites australis]|uniref:uncharacterized protein LOC133884166 n=1 Tax=Phragmites australis TaxID=29695 RepID=UPI002D797905|nr:uncharacterized protein LOC133884166 [Phragmites australis]